MDNNWRYYDVRVLLLVLTGLTPERPTNPENFILACGLGTVYGNVAKWAKRGHVTKTLVYSRSIWITVFNQKKSKSPSSFSDG